MKIKNIRIATYTVDYVLDNIQGDGTLDNDRVRAHNIALYKKFGVTCARCGIKGVFFAKERYKTNKKMRRKRWHLTLYAIKNGIEVPMTKDHIVPRMRGGTNTIDNYQVLCYNCNIAKGNKLESK